MAWRRAMGGLERCVVENHGQQVHVVVGVGPGREDVLAHVRRVPLRFFRRKYGAVGTFMSV